MRMRITAVGAVIGTTIGRRHRPRPPRAGGRGASTRPRPRRRSPGDDLVPSATAVETRGDHRSTRPPEAVWPWLVQMGFGRAGWYSYDQLDMGGSSATRILPEYAVRRGRRRHADLADGRVRRARGRAATGAGRCTATRRSSETRRPCSGDHGRGQPTRCRPACAASGALPAADVRKTSPRAGRSSSSRSTAGGPASIERFRVRFEATGPDVPRDRPAHGLRRLR